MFNFYIEILYTENKLCPNSFRGNSKITTTIIHASLKQVWVEKILFQNTAIYLTNHGADNERYPREEPHLLLQFYRPLLVPLTVVTNVAIGDDAILISVTDVTVCGDAILVGAALGPLTYGMHERTYIIFMT